jgi:hypothetical protein
VHERSFPAVRNFCAIPYAIRAGADFQGREKPLFTPVDKAVHTSAVRQRGQKRRALTRFWLSMFDFSHAALAGIERVDNVCNGARETAAQLTLASNDFAIIHRE